MSVCAFLWIRMKEMRKFTEKAISVFLSLAAVVSYPVACGAESVRLGDVNGDSTVNSADALAVLKYCVGNLELSSETLLSADVNADKRVNSADALEILRYTVGIIDRFKAEVTETVGAEEAIEAFNKAIEKAKDVKPYYTFNETVSNNVDDVKAKSNNPLISSSRLRQIEESQKKENSFDKKYVSIIKQKSDKSAQEMLNVFDCTDISKYADVDCVKNDSGHYLITVKFKGEKNPTENSQIVKVLGRDDYNTAKKTVEERNEVGGAKSNIEIFDFIYTDCFIKCEIDPLTSEFIDMEWSSTCVSHSKVTTVGLTIEMNETGKRGAHYSRFGY